AHPGAALVVAGMEAPPNMGPDYTAQFRAVFPAIAESFGAIRVPFLLENVGGVARLNQADGIHPTAEGQRVMAGTVWETLAPILRRQAS
ncbi:MAG: arylesterase, partial [Rhodothermaceae bacterium]|nr:arylesterase [Rhodothermaceae bacterium]